MVEEKPTEIKEREKGREEDENNKRAAKQPNERKRNPEKREGMQIHGEIPSIHKKKNEATKERANGREETNTRQNIGGQKQSEGGSERQRVAIQTTKATRLREQGRSKRGGLAEEKEPDVGRWRTKGRAICTGTKASGLRHRW